MSDSESTAVLLRDTQVLIVLYCCPDTTRLNYTMLQSMEKAKIQQDCKNRKRKQNKNSYISMIRIKVVVSLFSK